MEQRRSLISLAIGTAVTAVVALGLAIAARADAEAPPGPIELVQPPSPPVAPDVTAPIATAPPKIDGAKARASVADLGVELAIDAAVTLAGPLDRRESVTAKASCKIEGEWYAGTGSMRLSRLPAGTSVVTTTVRIGTQHAFTTPPTECQLGFEYRTYKPFRREWLARMCWDGTAVTDRPCAVKATNDVAVSSMRVSTRHGFEVSIDATLERPLDDKRIEVAADCTLHDGSTQRSTARVLTSGVHAGRPFTSRAWLFGRGQQMTGVPASCTVAVELADVQQLVREPVSAFCWRAGDVTSGACSA